MRILDYAAGGLAQKAQAHLHFPSRDIERSVLLLSSSGHRTAAAGWDQHRHRQACACSRRGAIDRMEHSAQHVTTAQGADDSSGHARACVMPCGHAHRSGSIFCTSHLRWADV